MVEIVKSGGWLMLPIILCAIIAMGKSLKLRMVAEGVDDAEQFRFLAKQGIQVIQGYIFSKPIPGPEFAKLLVETPYRAQIDRMLAGGDGQ